MLTEEFPFQQLQVQWTIPSPQSVVSRNWFRNPCDCDTSNCVLSCEAWLLNVDGIFIPSDIKEVNNVDVYFLESETRVILSTAPGNSCELLLCLCQNECLFVIRNTFTKLWTFSTMQLFSLKWFGNHLKSQAAPSLRWISNDQRDSLGDENFCSVWIFWLIFCTDAKNCDLTFSSSILPLFPASWQFHNKIWNILHQHGIIWNILI